VKIFWICALLAAGFFLYNPTIMGIGFGFVGAIVFIMAGIASINNHH